MLFQKEQQMLTSLIGVSMASFTATLTVKGGDLKACGNGNDAFFNPDTDIEGASSLSTTQFFPTSGKRYTCDKVSTANGFECKYDCPVCD